MGTNGTDRGRPAVTPLEHTAFFDVDTRDGYVRIQQSTGDRTLYTPAEARDVAESIVEAADEARTTGERAETDERVETSE